MPKDPFRFDEQQVDRLQPVQVGQPNVQVILGQYKHKS